MKQATLVALLGRPLTSTEEANQKLYLKIAREYLEDALCFSFEESSQELTLDVREGYRTIFTGPFTSVSAVSVNDRAVEDTDYTTYLWDNRNSSWFNSIVFTDALESGDVLKITADWGFYDCMPSDLQLVYAKLFALASSGVASDVSVQSKKVEDFSITFANADKTAYQRLIDSNAQTISKYSLCNIGDVQNGLVCI